MSISLLNTFADDGDQSDVTVEKVNEIITAVNGAGGLPSQTGNSGKFLTTNGTAASWGAVSTAHPVQARIAIPAASAGSTWVTPALYTLGFSSGAITVMLAVADTDWTPVSGAQWTVKVSAAGTTTTVGTVTNADPVDDVNSWFPSVFPTVASGELVRIILEDTGSPTSAIPADVFAIVWFDPS